MKITYQQIHELNAAMTALPLKSLSILDAAVNMTVLQKHLDALSVAKKKTIAQYTDKEYIGPDHEKWNDFLVEWNAVLNTEVDVGEIKGIRKDDIDLTRENLTINPQAAIALLINLELLVSNSGK